MESNDRSIRNPVIINRFPRSNELVPQRRKVPNGRCSSNVLEVRSGFRRQTLLPVFLQLGVRLRHAGVKLIEFLRIPKVGRNGLVDGPHDGIIPKRSLFRIGTEASYVAGTVSEAGCVGRWEGSSYIADQTDQRDQRRKFKDTVLVGLRVLLGYGSETHNV